MIYCNFRHSGSIWPDKEKADMREERLKYLLYKFLSHSLTNEESQELDNFIRIHPTLSQLREDKDELNKVLSRMASIDTGTNLELVLSRIHSQPVSRKRVIPMRMKPLVAAAVVSTILAGAYFLLSNHQPDKQAKIANAAIPELVPPGRNRAILKLASGKEINMDTVSDGKMVMEGIPNIIKKDSGTLTYAGLTPSLQQNTGEADLNNILSTPKAGQFVVVLADGTKVSLNNASSLTYPTAFTGKTREVEVTGEAYFEVAPNAHQPFLVHRKDLTVEVLGTGFNISDYSDEKGARITLETGKIRVSYKGQSRILDSVRPVAAVGEESLQYQNGDPEKYLSWKKGIFYFSYDNLADVMRQIGRWYNIITHISGDPDPHTYTATIPRSNDLAATLEILSNNNDNAKKYFHYSLIGNELFITR